MTAEAFVAALGAIFAGLLAWGWRVLPAERWQVLAAVPRRRDADGTWEGTNLTWYGALTALGYALAAALALVLLRAVGVPLPAVALLAGALLAACVPASRLVAAWVEGTRHGFTVGGAAFVGTVLAPWLALGVGSLGRRWGWHVPPAPALAALAIAYAAGEGVGRLACVSFGCCYGVPVEEAPRWLRPLFARCPFVFRGATKKAAYASGLEGRALVPVQGLTSALYLGATLVGTWLFLGGRPVAALALAAVSTHGWRALSECLRADWRGGGRLTAYQRMALAGGAYALAAAFLLPPGPAPAPDLRAGLEALWSPGALLGLQVLGAALFLLTGRSTVTSARLSFRVCLDRAERGA